MVEERAWPAQWTRGTLEIAALAAIGSTSAYGYLIAQRMTAAGLGPVKGGTLYPLLTRLEEAGLVASQWEPGERGPGRKFFRLTEAGVTRLRDERALFVRFTSAVLHLIDSSAVTS